MLAAMPPAPSMPLPRPRRSRTRRDPHAVVLGDLALDVVLVPARPVEHGTDVPGAVRLHQGGSAANTARWLARLGVRATLVCAVGRDGPGRALIADLRADGVDVRATRPAGARTGRIGMVVDAAGERSFVADRGAADLLAPADLRPSWFAGAGVLHLPAYSLLGAPLGDAARRAVALAREARRHGLRRPCIGGAAAGRRPAGGSRAVEAVAPDLLFTTAAEAAAFLGVRDPAGLLRFAPVAVVKRGADGATLLARTDGGPVVRLEVATRPLPAADTTGAGDAFDAGFLASLAGARSLECAGRPSPRGHGRPPRRGPPAGGAASGAGAGDDRLGDPPRRARRRR